jgi:hypothetical protein
MFSPLTSSPSSPTMPSQRVGSTTNSGSRSNSMLKLILLFAIAVQASAWGSSSSSDSGYDVSMYGNALERDWLYDSSGMSIELQGCVWGYVDDNEDSGCMEDSSEDGTSYWYQMANCRRAQAVFSVFASSSSHASCNNGNFKETVSLFEMEKDTLLKFAPIAHSCFSLVILKYSHSLLPEMGFRNLFTTSRPTIPTALFPIVIMAATTMETMMVVETTMTISRTSQCVHQQMGNISVLAARMMVPSLFSTLAISTA